MFGTLQCPKIKMENNEKTFEIEWEIYAKEEKIYGRTEREQKDYLLNFGFEESWFKGKRILDAGCGHGTFTKIFAEMGASEVIGVDISEKIVKIAYNKIKHLQNAKVLKYDLTNNLNSLGKFDLVFSVGVIHHTGNTKLAFMNLTRVVKNGGYMTIWVYPKKGLIWENGFKFIRLFTTKIPKNLLYHLCYVLIPVLYFVPAYTQTHPNKNTWKECTHCIYDWLAPKYQSHHSFEELKQWFVESGFINIKRALIDTGATGKKNGENITRKLKR